MATTQQEPLRAPDLSPIQPDKPSFWRRHRRLLVFLVVAAIIGAGVWTYGLVKDSPALESADTTAAKIRSEANPNHWQGVIDPAALPLGDGKVSTAPKADHIYSCTTDFRDGAEHSGPWINDSNKTWDSKAKVTVQGAITWPAANHSEKISGQTRIITTNGLPKGYTTGIFPIAGADPAYQYDSNPNSIGIQALTYELPLNPTAAPTPSCTGLGAIGVLTNGVALFNGLDAAGHDAVAHETQDSCNGHPDGQEMYHYHNIPACLRNESKGSAVLIGYANDGYGIYVERDARGNLPTNADLDECHGRVSEVTWNGKKTSVYHYSATLEYPYTVGCYHGKPVNVGGAHAGVSGLNEPSRNRQHP